MAKYSPNSEKALKIAEKVRMIDSEEILEIFKKLIKKGIYTQPIMINVPKDIIR